MKKIINNKHAKSVLELTESIIDKTGTRLTGTESCRQAGRIIYSNLEKFCDKVYSEHFKCSRDAFLFHIRYFSVSYILSYLIMIFLPELQFIATFLTVFGCFIILFEFVFYFEFIDLFFKKTDAYNISGIINPKGTINQQIIVSGHYDSPYVFSFLNKHQKLYKLRIAISMIFYFMITGLCIQISYSSLFNPMTTHLSLHFIIVLGIGIFILGQYYFFINWDVSPGAGDNLVSSCIIIKLSELFSNKIENSEQLKNTRLIFLCPDAEESGLRGAKEYVKKHNKNLQLIPTYNFNLDSIYELKDLKLLESEVNGTIPLDINLRKKCIAIAKSLGYSISSIKMPFGGGSTDAAEFAKAGVVTASMIGLDTTFSNNNVPYHTSFDTVDKIDNKAVLACLQIIQKLIIDIDNDKINNS